MTQGYLQQAYSRQNWQNWLTEIFGSQIQFETQAENIGVDRENIKSIQRFASVKLADGKTLAVFDIETHAGVQISRNRVGLRNLVEKFIDHTRYHGILAFYHSNILAEYRMSFISSEPKIDDSGNFVIEHTSPKRYTYLLGKNAKTKTPADRLNIIAAKQGTATLEDITKAFSVETLAKEFYAELFAWYQWALSGEIGVTFPNEIENKKIDEHLIRLITRLMFVWFIKQKNLVPETIFDIDKLKSILKNFNATNSEQDNYYRAILQNLFFATLNNKIEDRCFAADGTYHENKVQYGIKTLYRYADDFSISNDEVVELFGNVPFLNGGLFECLDKDTPDSNGKIVYCDGFSRRKDRQSRAHIPNILFFDKDRGIIPLLSKYNFTIEENTPDDVNVALDPELLGKVFENLLGTYNPETKETARKQSGSFYTPREIVNYMVDESLIAYLEQVVGEQYEDVFRKLFAEKPDIEVALKKQIYEALRNGKILDPACGSGAFPMGILNRIICIMENLDYSHSIFELKLHLIENCIYGVDIQSIAVQISKLRFFISLICEQTPNKDVADNFGIKPLPNLETKFVAANTLIGLNKKKEGDFTADLFEDPQIEVTKKSLLEIRHLHFSADTARKKREYRSKDKELREKLANLLEVNNDFAPEDAKQLALWNPYDQNASSPFFDMEWMFGLKEGFDIVIGNPPYFSLTTDSEQADANGKKIKHNCLYGIKKGQKWISTFQSFDSSGDIYCLFYERGWQLLKPQGHLCYITSNKWMRAGYGENTRKFFSENTNPEQLIDFAGIKVFESATVDTNILMFSKDKNRQQTQACIVKKEGIKDLSVFVRQSSTICNFGMDSWVVLSPIEQRIKAKIEAVGTPLKDWDIQINYGIKTGFNDAFIISGEKRQELIGQDSKSAEIIRPLLRGRDIKRYGYEYADLYLITTFPSLKIDIELYPAVKQHLLSFGYDRLKQTGEVGARKKTNNQWFETQDSIGYWEDFYRQKIIYIEIMTDNPDDGYDFPSFSFDERGCILLNTAYMMSGDSDDLKYILAILNSKFGRQLVKFYVTQLQNRQFRMLHQSVINFPIPKISTKEKDIFIRLVEIILTSEYFAKQQNELNGLVYHLFNLSEEEVQFIESQ